ncbi:hypothetical protein HYX58_05430 [Candidatus Dependentiae bacterium]|nr:hypothetical protein [Candidatus Dependentiae bacterium]
MFKFKYLYFSFCVFLSHTNFGMEKEGKGEILASGMIKIESARDIKPFLERIVAYKAVSPYLIKKNEYSLSDSSPKYAYVRSLIEHEINPIGSIARLIHKNTASPYLYGNLTDSNVKEGFCIRYATLDEITAIKGLIDSDQAELEHIDKKNGFTILQSQLNEHP